MAKASSKASRTNSTELTKSGRRSNLAVTPNGLRIGVATLNDIRKAAKSQCSGSGLVRIPSKCEREKVYKETADTIAAHESAALTPFGGRPWKCTVRITEPSLRQGKSRDKKQSKYDKRGPLFRWYRGKLELASLPHILEKIPEVEIIHPARKDNADEVDCFSSHVEQMQDSRRAPSAMSLEASDHAVFPQPIVVRTWLSPQHHIFKSRKAAAEHSDELAKRDELIDRVLFGRGARGQRLRSFRPTRKQILQAGVYRFERDGLWVVGQEESWQLERAREQGRKHVIERKDHSQVHVDEQEKDHGSIGAVSGPLHVSSSDQTHTRSSFRSVAITPPSSPGAGSGAIFAGDGSTSVSSEDTRVVPSLLQEKIRVHGSRDSGNVLVSLQSTDGCGSASDVKTVEASPQSGIDAVPEPLADNDSKGPNTLTTTGTNSAKASRRRRKSALKDSARWCLKKDQIDLCYDACTEHYEKVMYTVKARGLFHELGEGFDVFRERGRGRFDMELDLFDTDRFSFLTDQEAPWMEIVKAVLGADATLIHKGCFLSLPGAEAQVYHQDGVHLTYKQQKPCHAVNVFIPLIDMEAKNGPTEFCLGTHILEHECFLKEMCEKPLPKAGTPVIFDYRLGHRGLANTSKEPRPILYLTYTQSTSTFKDDVNFSRKRYRPLGEISTTPPSREERARRRQKLQEE